MKISNNGIIVPKQQNNISPTFKSSKLIHTVGNSSALVSAAVTAAGIASLAINKSSNSHIVDSIPDGAELNYDDIKQLFSNCIKPDCSYDKKLLDKTLKKVVTAKNLDDSSGIVIDLIKTYGNLDNISLKYPEFTEFFAGSVCNDTYSIDRIKNEIKSALNANFLNSSFLKTYEKFLKEGYILENGHDYTELHDKSLGLNFLREEFPDKFDKLPFELKNGLLTTYKNVVKDVYSIEKHFLQGLVMFADEAGIKHYCDNPAEIKPAMDKLIDIISTDKNLNYAIFPKDNDSSMLTKIAFMKLIYPQNYNALINSNIFEEIKKGNINPYALDNIDISQYADDRYLKPVVADFEKKIEAKINNIPNIDSYPVTKSMFKYLHLSESEANKIYENIINSKDKNLTDNVLENISQFYSYQKQNQKEKNFIKNVLSFSCEEPETFKKLLAINGYDRKVLFQGISMLKRTGDNAILDKLTNKNINKDFLPIIFKYITSRNKIAIEKYLDSTNNIDLKHLAKLLALKNFNKLNDPQICNARIKEFENLTQELDKNFSEEDFKSYLTDLHYLVPLLDMKVFTPNKFDKIKQLGYFDLCKKEDYGIDYLKILNSNSDLSDNVYDDLFKIQTGIDIVPSYKSGTSLEDVFAFSKCGDVVEVDNQLYINDGSKLIKWQMTKQKYLELFPPVKRFINIQRNLGNCYLVSSLSAIMENPKTRVELYKSIAQDGNDILVTIKAYEDYKGTVRFDNSELPYKEKDFYLKSCKGMQMLEYAYSKTTLRTDPSDAYVVDDILPEDCVERANGGRVNIAMSELLGINFIDPDYKIPQNFSKSSFDYTPGEWTEDLLEDCLETYANDNRYILHLCTTSSADPSSARLSLKYNLVDNHAHYIKYYNSNTREIILVNPHNSAVETKVPIDKMVDMINSITITSLD